MLRGIFAIVLAFFLAFGVLGLLSPAHEGMMPGMTHATAQEGMAHEEPGEASAACLLHCLAQADHGVAGDLVLPLLLALVAMVVVVVADYAAPTLPAFAFARAGPVSRYCEQFALSVCKRE